MTDTSPTVSSTSASIRSSRYPRPAWFRALRWLFIHWWILPIACLYAYVVLATILNTLLSNLLFLVQHWWAILLALLALAGVGTVLFPLYRWADDDQRAERRERDQHRPHGFELRHILRGHSADVNSVAWAPDGHTLASSSKDTTIRLWDAASGQQSGILEGHTGLVYGISFSSDGRLLASKSTDNSVRFWNTATWDEVGLLKEFGNGSILNDIATNDFDVFLCHHGVDKPAVKAIAEQLKERGMLP